MLAISRAYGVWGDWRLIRPMSPEATGLAFAAVIQQQTIRRRQSFARLRIIDVLRRSDEALWKFLEIAVGSSRFGVNCG